jgi:hypothetical protein
MTFVYCDTPIDLPVLQIVDVIPPAPSKLQIAVQALKQVGVIPEAYPVRFNLIDERELLEQVREDPVLIPCKFSELMDNSPRRILSVDKNLHQLQDSSVHVVGCQRTREAAEAHGIAVSTFKDICPQQNLPQEGIFLAKCCLTRSEVEYREEGNGKGIIVPWGFNYAHIFEAGILLQELILDSIRS